MASDRHVKDVEVRRCNDWTNKVLTIFMATIFKILPERLLEPATTEYLVCIAEKRNPSRVYK